MSIPEALYPLLGVLIGGLLSPFAQGIGYLVTRHLRERDQRRDDRRRVLIEFQDAILELVKAEQDSLWSDMDKRAHGNNARAVANRKIRLLAARIDDEELWTLVHTPNPVRWRELHEAGSPGEPGDTYDAWNKRARELYADVAR